MNRLPLKIVEETIEIRRFNKSEQTALEREIDNHREFGFSSKKHKRNLNRKNKKV